MSKPLRLRDLKEWLSVKEAARHLSILFGEDLDSSDVLQLALDGHLKLSVRFVNAVHARRCKISSYKNDIAEVLKQIEVGKMVIPLCLHRVAELETAEELLSGVWDLPMFGDERLGVEREYQTLTEGAPITRDGYQGIFVASASGDQIFAVHERVSSPEYDQVLSSVEQMKKHIRGQDYWRRQLKVFPEGSSFVVRPAALRDFEAKLSSGSDSGKSEKPLATRERNTLLTIIAGLCDFSGINPSDKGVAKQLSAMTDDIGAPVSEDTVLAILKKIPDALESRMK